MKEWNEKCLSIDKVPDIISITSSDGVVRNSLFFLQNTQVIIRKHLALVREEKVVLRQFVQDNTPKYPLHSNF